MRTHIVLLVMATIIAGCSVQRQNDRDASNYSSSAQLSLCLNVHDLDPEGFMDCVRNSHLATPGIACITARQRPLAMRCIAEENDRRQGQQTNNCQELFGASCAPG